MGDRPGLAGSCLHLSQWLAACAACLVHSSCYFCGCTLGNNGMQLGPRDMAACLRRVEQDMSHCVGLGHPCTMMTGTPEDSWGSVRWP